MSIRPQTQKTLTFAKQYQTNFFLYPINLLAIIVNFLKNSKFYEEEMPNVNQTKDEKLSFVC